MRCPKCGYNSFDYLDSCKKCGKDLVEFKQRYGLKSILLPGALGATGATGQEEFSDADATELTGTAVAGTTAAAAAKAAASTESETSTPAPVAEPADAVDFGFDFMGDSSDDDDDLTFDELFEDTLDDEDIEETLEAPKHKPQPSAVDTEADTTEPAAEVTESDEAFSFDLPDADDEQNEELENDFGFDPENLDFEEEPLAGEETKKRQGAPEGSREGPHDPFELPESSQAVGAPVTEISAAIDAPALHLPSLTNRCFAFCSDVAILFFAGLCFLVAGEMAQSSSSNFLPSTDALVNLAVPYFLILFFLAFSYYTLFHFLAGQTPGEMLTGLRVETVEGTPLSLAQAFLRSVGSLAQLLPLGLGLLVVVARPDRRGWNDQFAGTRVVVAATRDLSHP